MKNGEDELIWKTTPAPCGVFWTTRDIIKNAKRCWLHNRQKKHFLKNSLDMNPGQVNISPQDTVVSMPPFVWPTLNQSLKFCHTRRLKERFRYSIGYRLKSQVGCQFQSVYLTVTTTTMSGIHLTACVQLNLYWLLSVTQWQKNVFHSYQS